MEINADCRDEKSPGPAQRRGEHRAPRPSLLDPPAHYGRGGPEEEDIQAEDPAELGQLPVDRCGLRDPDELRERQVEDAECIGLANTQMDAEGRRWNEPSAKAWLRDRPISMQKCAWHISSRAHFHRANTR